MRGLVIAAVLATATTAFARQPTGEGDPAAQSCMYIEQPTGKAGGGALCKANAEWAQMAKDGVKLDQFGEPIPPPDARGDATHGCTQIGGGAIDKDGRHIAGFNCH